jgi:hypothetical protein
MPEDSNPEAVPKSVITGMIEVLGENSRIAGRVSEVANVLVEKVSNLPTHKQFTVLALAASVGVTLAVAISIIAVVIAVNA